MTENFIYHMFTAHFVPYFIVIKDYIVRKRPYRYKEPLPRAKNLEQLLVCKSYFTKCKQIQRSLRQFLFHIFFWHCLLFLQKKENRDKTKHTEAKNIPCSDIHPANVTIQSLNRCTRTAEGQVKEYVQSLSQDKKKNGTMYLVLCTSLLRGRGRHHDKCFDIKIQTLDSLTRNSEYDLHFAQSKL